MAEPQWPHATVLADDDDASSADIIAAVGAVLLPLCVPITFTLLLVLPLVYYARRWHKTSSPVLDFLVGPPPQPMPTEGAPLLQQTKGDAPHHDTPPPFWREVLDLAICTVGVLVSHLLYGYYQEQLMTQDWSTTSTVTGNGEEVQTHTPGNEERFLHASFTTLLNRLFSLVLALSFIGVARLFNGGPLDMSAAPLWEYSIAALANNVSSVSQYASIHFISFPTLVLSKACKMPPVMFVNVLIFKRGYQAFEYTGAMLVLMGASLWLLYEEGAGAKHDSSFNNDDSVGGFILVVIYIAADAYASTWQGHVFSRGTSIYPMFLWSNAWAVVFSALSSFGTSEFSDALAFLGRHPSAWYTLLVLSIVSAFGNLFLLYTIQRFGPLAFASIATVRQLLSSIISIIAFHHAVQLLQVTGLLIVFMALGMITRIKVHERSLKAKRAELKAAKDAAATATGGSEPHAIAEVESVSEFGRWLSATFELTFLRPPARALLVMGFVVVVAVVKSCIARIAIVSTQRMDADGQSIHTTGVAYSALSCAYTVLYATTMFIIEPGSLSTPDWDLVPALAVISALSAIDLACTNSAIARLPALQQQVLAASHPMITVVFESLLHCQLKHPAIYMVVATLTIGAALVSIGNENAMRDMASTSPFASDRVYGSIMMLVAVVAAALKYVVVKCAVRAKRQIGTISFVFWVDMVAFLSISSVAMLNHEFDTLVEALTESAYTVNMSLLFLLACSLGGARFFTEVFALRFVAAVDVSAAKTVANAIYIILAVIAPQFINGNAPQFININYSSVDPAVFASGLFLLFGSLGVYCWLQRCLGTKGIAVATCVPGFCMHLGVLSGKLGDLESDLARDGDPDDEGFCCRERDGKAPPEAASAKT